MNEAVQKPNEPTKARGKLNKHVNPSKPQLSRDPRGNKKQYMAEGGLL